MNRTGFTSAVAHRADVSIGTADRVLVAFEETLREALAQEQDVTLPGLLTVKRVERAARTGRNPQTGETLDIPARAGVKITPGTRLKSAVGGTDRA